MALRLADALSLDVAERDAFVAFARGHHPSAGLTPPDLNVAAAPRDSLPLPTTTLIGREGELATVLALLERSDVRLVTLLGQGGIGKTRLALAVGETLRRTEPRLFRSGIVYVDLAATTTADALVLGIMAALGFEPDTRSGNARLDDHLANYLRDRPYLLILDNLEQIQGASTVISQLLAATLQPRFLITSRQRLSLTWEHIVSLPGLAYSNDPADDPASFPAGRLFLHRAGRIMPGYDLEKDEHQSLAELCTIVDGMPLALELAAGWVDTLRLDEIVVELRRDLGVLRSELLELPERHRSLRAVWESTWQRLEETERLAFARLSVFQGGFTRAAAEPVAGASLGILARLTGSNLVSVDRAAGRYRLHELLRQFGYEKLVERGESESIHQRHFDFYLDFAGEQVARLHSRQLPEAQAAFAVEMDNLTCALEWALERPELADAGAELFNALSWHWRIRTQIAEASAWSARMLSASGRSGFHQAMALNLDGHFAWMRGETETARDRQVAALDSLAECDKGDPAVAHLAAVVDHHLAMAVFGMGEFEAALRLMESSVATFRRLDDRWWLAFSLSWLDRAAYALGETERAADAREEQREIARSIGDPWLAIHTVHYAEILFEEGRLEESRQEALAAVRSQQITGHLHSLGQSYMFLGRISRRQGEEDAATAYFQQAIALFDSIGHELFVAKARDLMRNDA